jgi:hypothetical protein
MQLQRRFAYKYKSRDGTKSHYKYVITIPENIIDELTWKEGELLKPRVENSTLLVELYSSDSTEPKSGKKNRK